MSVDGPALHLCPFRPTSELFDVLETVFELLALGVYQMDIPTSI